MLIIRRHGEGGLRPVLAIVGSILYETLVSFDVICDDVVLMAKLIKFGREAVFFESNAAFPQKMKR